MIVRFKIAVEDHPR